MPDRRPAVAQNGPKFPKYLEWLVTRPSFHTVWIGSSNSRVFLKRAAVAALSYRP